MLAIQTNFKDFSYACLDKNNDQHEQQHLEHQGTKQHSKPKQCYNKNTIQTLLHSTGMPSKGVLDQPRFFKSLRRLNPDQGENNNNSLFKKQQLKQYLTDFNHHRQHRNSNKHNFIDSTRARNTNRGCRSKQAVSDRKLNRNNRQRTNRVDYRMFKQDNSEMIKDIRHNNNNKTNKLTNTRLHMDTSPAARLIEVQDAPVEPVRREVKKL
jgi:hypothetical protein